MNAATEKNFGPRLKWWAVGFFGQLIMRLLYLTVRARAVGCENLAPARAQGAGPVIYAILHGRLLGNSYHNRNQDICVMISRHRDGEIIARITRRLGFIPARGSDTRGSTAALKHMLRLLKSGHDSGFTVDGPRGPAGVVKPGVVHASSRSGCPIIPLASGYSRCWKFSSWDRFQVPKPFCRMVSVYGNPITVPDKLSETELGDYTRKVAEELGRISRLADNLARPLERPGRAGSLASAESFLYRERNRWYQLPVLALLSPLEWAYRLCWNIRDSLYNRGILKTSPAPVPTICVGSLFIGGAGKTPVAMMMARILAARGLKTALLTRGYGRTAKTARRLSEIIALAGDEAALAWQRLESVGLAVAADRVAGASAAVEHLGAEVLVMDDGFGHRRFGRNMDLLVVNSRLLKLNGHLLPGGALREPFSAATRAHAVVICSQAGDTKCAPPDWASGLKILRVNRSVEALVPLKDWLDGKISIPQEPRDILHRKKILAFCGIARPEGFRDTLLNFDPGHLELVAFEDHCRYNARKQKELSERAEKAEALLITTEKDAVKLDPELIGSECLVLCLALEPEDKGAIEKNLDKLLAGNSQK
jgi:tetraacyldisaccharide 4'-kinase